MNTICFDLVNRSKEGRCSILNSNYVIKHGFGSWKSDPGKNAPREIIRWKNDPGKLSPMKITLRKKVHKKIFKGNFPRGNRPSGNCP